MQPSPGSPRRCGSEVQETGHERTEESAQVAARQGRRCRDRSLRQRAILANGRARTTNRQRRPLARRNAKARRWRSPESTLRTTGEPRGCPRNGQGGEQNPAVSDRSERTGAGIGAPERGIRPLVLKKSGVSAAENQQRAMTQTENQKI